jgi:hypothetical protein
MKKSLEEFDHRTVAREPQQFIGARILSAEGFALGACTVANLSRSGAMLRASGDLPLRTGMGLLVDGEEDVRSFEVVWQTAAHTGVRFLTPDMRGGVYCAGDALGRSALGAGWLSSLGRY